MTGARRKTVVLLLLSAATGMALLAVGFVGQQNARRIYYTARLLPPQQWTFGPAVNQVSADMEQSISPNGEAAGVVKTTHYAPYNLGMVQITRQ